MMKDKMVRIRFRRDYAGQACWVFFGRVVRFSEHWLAVKGKGVLVFKRQAIAKTETIVKDLRIEKAQPVSGEVIPVEIDEECRTLLFPRDTVANIRILPDDFDVNSLKVVVCGRRIDVVVEGAPNTSIDEIAEG
jgi:hypothetical protein